MYCTLLCHLLSATEIFPDVKKNEQNLDKKIIVGSIDECNREAINKKKLN